MKKAFISIMGGVAAALALPAIAFAHVIVTPSQAAVGASTMFNVSVPNEKQVAVTSVKLDVPKGVENASPDELAGWNITAARDANDNVTSITWTGTIPTGQRADFTFKAQAPAKAGDLDWKAYQTYADGSVVNWNQNPATNGKAVKDTAGPYSITKVVNDLTPDSSNSRGSNSRTATLALVFGIAALILSLGGLFLRRKR